MGLIKIDISDNSHSILEPNLHDGRLLGIDLPSKSRADLTVAEVSGTRYHIVLDGVLAFHATDFREGNIILDVTVAHGENVQLADLASLGYADQNAPHRAEANLNRLHERVRRESLFVLELNPSYGCHLIGVAKAFWVESVG
jgi:hypothetical protein